MKSCAINTSSPGLTPGLSGCRSGMRVAWGIGGGHSDGGQRSSGSWKRGCIGIGEACSSHLEPRRVPAGSTYPDTRACRENVMLPPVHISGQHRTETATWVIMGRQNGTPPGPRIWTLQIWCGEDSGTAGSGDVTSGPGGSGGVASGPGGSGGVASGPTGLPAGRP